MAKPESQDSQSMHDSEQWIMPVENRGLPLSYFENVVVTRTPPHIKPLEKQAFISTLISQRCLPIIPPSGKNDMSSLINPWIFWPTDEFRQIGNTIFYNGISTLDGVIRSMQRAFQTEPNASNNIQNIQNRTIRVPVGFTGGDYHALHATKRFFYAKNKIPGLSDAAWMCRATKRITFPKTLELLKNDGWSIEQGSTNHAYLQDSDSPADLDFLFFPFMGRDSSVHAIVAQAFSKYVPKYIIPHEISNEEALRAGCNIADCCNGTLLIHSHRDDAPTTYEVLNEFSRETLIEAPRNYLEGCGGPRCLTSSFSLNTVIG